MLRIGYIRLNSDIRINFSSPNNGQGVEHRRAFLHALLSQNHEVTIVSRISNQDLPLLKIRGEWYNRLKYDLDCDPNKFDVIILEAASSNPRFSRLIEGEEVSMLQFTMRLLNKYKGSIYVWAHIYGQTSLFPFQQNLLPPRVDYKCANGHKFPWLQSLTEDKKQIRDCPTCGKELVPVLEQLSAINWRRVLGELDLFQDKKWTILHHALDEEGFKHVRSSRFAFCYADLPQIQFKYIHLPKSDLDPYYPINPKPKWDALYIGSRFTNSVSGSEYDRLPPVKRFYETPKFRAAVLGHMGDSAATHSHSKIEVSPFQYAQKLHTDNSSIPVAMSMWHNSLTHIFTESDAARKIGSMTGRTFLSLDSGSLLLVDKSISGVGKLGLAEYEVSDSEEASNKISEFKQLSPEQRDQRRVEQLATFPDWKEIQWDTVLRP